MQQLATRMRLASTTDPDGETLPWSEATEQALLSATPRHRSLFKPAWLVLALAFAAIAGWRLLPLVGDPGLLERHGLPLMQGIATGVLGVLLLVGLVLWQWRAQRLAENALRRTADHLRRGAWESAAENLRPSPESAVPSAFGELAAQVEGVMGESERRWKARAELSADWYWETDEQGRLSYLSADAPMVHPDGRTLADLLGKRHDQLGFVRPGDGDWSAFHDRLERQERFRGLELSIHGNGSGEVGWVALNGRPRWRRDGRFAGYEGVGSDITAQKAAFRHLQASEGHHSALVALAADWSWRTDALHRFPAPDAEQLRRFGGLARLAEGRTLWEAHPHALSPSQWQAHRDDLDARRAFRALEFAVRRDDGRTSWLSLAGMPQHAENGHFIGYVGVGRDITLRKMSEQMLVKHNRELQLAVAARTRDLEMTHRDLNTFAQHLAGELRTPIAQVGNLAELLGTRLADRLQVDESTLIDLQRRAATDMQATLEALLELARSATEGLSRQEVELSQLAESVIAELPPIQRTASVAWDIQPGLVAWASPSQMRVVMHKLLDNAAKFTRRCERPVVSFTGAHDTEGLLTLKVSDNGAGFDSNRAERLFQPFQRLHGQDDYQGMGIGLTIVQRIVQRHGGSISASGSPGKGASFEFTLGQRAR